MATAGRLCSGWTCSNAAPTSGQRCLGNLPEEVTTKSDEAQGWADKADERCPQWNESTCTVIWHLFSEYFLTCLLLITVLR